MDLNKASVEELQDLRGIGSARASAIVQKREEIKRSLCLGDLSELSPDVPYSIWENLIAENKIMAVPPTPLESGASNMGQPSGSHSNGKELSDHTLLEELQKSMGSMIKLTVELTGRMALLEERMTIRDQEESHKMKVENCKGLEEKSIASELKQGNLLSNERNVDVGANAGGSLQAPIRGKAENDHQGPIFKAKMPIFDGSTRWQSYLLQFETILKMYNCTCDQLKVGKLVEALRGKALNYFESLSPQSRSDFGILCVFMESRFGSQEHPPIVSAKLQSSVQLLDESLDEFAERVQRYAVEGYPGMPTRWVQLMAVDVLLKGCLDKRAALQTMDKEPAVLSQAVDYLKRFANYEKALGLGNKGMRQVQLESKTTERVPSPDLRKVSSSEVPTGQQSGSSDQVLSQLENISKQLATLLSRSTSTRRVTPGNCFVCDKKGHFARECPKKKPPGTSDEKNTEPSKNP